MTDEIYMDIPAVRQMAKTFGQLGDILEAVNKVLEGLSMTLKTTAFMGLVGGLAVAFFIDRIRPQIEDLAEKCHELNTDLDASVTAYENGDAVGATRFY
jgi:hypothetical protein